MSRWLYVGSPGQLLATPTMEQIIADLKRVKARIMKLEADEKILSDRVRLYMGDTTMLFDHAGELLATYNRADREGVDIDLLKMEYPKTFEKVRTVTPTRTLLLR